MKLIRILILLLCSAILLCGCASEHGGGTVTQSTGEVTSGDAGSTTGADVSTAGAADTVSLVADGKPVYKVVRPEEASEMLTSVAIGLRKELSDICGVSFGIGTDFIMPGSDPANDREILLGGVDREEAKKAAAGLSGSEYVIAVDGNKIVIAGGSDYACGKGAEAFLAMLTADTGFTLSGTLRITGKAESGNLLGVTNQGESCIEVYSLPTRTLGKSELVWRYRMPYYNVADMKLRTDPTHGEVALAVCGSGCAMMITYPAGKLIWSTEKAANNPHSIELLPDGIIAVASSTGNAVRFFTLSSDEYKGEVTLGDAHGVLWDPENEVLWALGGNVLTAYSVRKDAAGGVGVTEVTERRVTVPTGSGHDLAPYYGDTNILWLTSGSAVYQFNKTTGAFSTAYDGSQKINLGNVKSIGNFRDGTVTLTVPDGAFKSWTTATVDIFTLQNGGYAAGEAVSATGAFYKCRVWCADYQ